MFQNTTNQINQSSFTITRPNLNVTTLNDSTNTGTNVNNQQTNNLEIDSKDSIILSLINKCEKTKNVPTVNGKSLRVWRRRVIKLIGSYILMKK